MRDAWEDRKRSQEEEFFEKQNRATLSKMKGDKTTPSSSTDAESGSASDNKRTSKTEQKAGAATEKPANLVSRLLKRFFP